MGSSPLYWTPQGMAFMLSNPQLMDVVSRQIGQGMDSVLPIQDLLSQLFPPQVSQAPQLSPTEQAIQAQGSSESVAQQDPLANWETGLASIRQQGDTAQSALQATPLWSPYWQSRMDQLRATTDASESWRGRLKPQGSSQ